MAEDPLAALLEVARGLTILSEGFLAARRLLTVTLATNFRVSDLTAAGAYRFGVTGDLAATADYTGPHAWAAALHAAGFDGLRHHVRHDPRSRLAGVAWFGRAGRARRLPAGYGQTTIPAYLLLDAAPFGIRIASDLL